MKSYIKEGADSLVQATSAGFYRAEDAIELIPQDISDKTVVLDVIMQSDTPFTERVVKKMEYGILGIEMWIRQAAKQFVFFIPEMVDEKRALHFLQQEVYGKTDACSMPCTKA